MSEQTARRHFLRFLAASPLAAALGEDPPAITDPAQAINVFDFEPAARKALPPAHYGYLSTGVDDDNTLRANRDGFTRLHLRPRRLINIAKVDTSVELFGTRWPSPIFLCPCGSQKAFHPEGEIAAARAGGTRKTLQVLSTVTTASVEDVTRAAGRPVWQQLYPPTRWEITERIIRRAEAAGSPVLVITVDQLAGRNTETDKRHARHDSRPCQSCHPVQTFSGRKPMFDGFDTKGVTLQNSGFTWETVRRVRALSPMKMLIKGIVTEEDAKLAMEHGMDGVVVSNHGGRAEETNRSTIDSLQEVVAEVGGKTVVLYDGGIRRGADVFKALALGARAVGIGRPYLWGLSAFGQPGVERVIDLLRAEFELVMKQCGTQSTPGIQASYVV